MHSDGPFRHEGEELLIVIRGQSEVTIENGRVHVLSTGDSMYLRNDPAHVWRNPSADTFEMIWICVGKSF